jgi:catecholate siderophore receptor
MLNYSFYTRNSLRCAILASTLITIITSANAAEIVNKNKTKKEVTRLPQITVTADSSEQLSSGAVDGYKAGATRSSTRTDTRLLDVPQSISVVTQEQIRDQNITSIGEAIRYTPGVVLHQGENNRDQITIRGNNSTADFFVDGARDDLQYFRDVYNMDRIEILKGPNAMAFGRGGSGGLINRVSKTADGKRMRQVTLQGGSFNNRRISADIGDKVNDKLSLRLNTMYEKSGTFRRYGNLERYGINPTATINLGEDTDLKVGYEHFHDSRFNDRGIPSRNGMAYETSPSTFFGDPNGNISEATVDSVFADLNHEFSSTLKIRNYTRYTDNTKFYQNVYASSAVNNSNNLNISAYDNATKRQNFTNQTDLTKKFSTGSISHTALMGMEIAKQNSRSFRNTGYFNNNSTTRTISASNPISFTSTTFRQSATDANNESEVNIYAGYIQDQIDISKYLQITAGLRYDIFEMNFHNNRTNQDFSRTDNLISPRAGLVFKPKDNLSFYTSYSVSYLPSSGDQFATLSAQTQALKPEEIQNYEIGTKWDVTSKLNLSAAIYQLDRTNTRAPNPANPTVDFVLTGATRTRGVELSANGKITDKWQIIASYAYQDAIIKNPVAASTAGTTTPAGNRVALVPQSMKSLWNKYDFTEKFAAGLGVIDQSGQFAAVDNSVRLKGFTRFDGALYYKINPSYRLQLNAENLFGAKYIQTAHDNNNLQPGSPRAVKVSLIANF